MKNSFRNLFLTCAGLVLGFFGLSNGAYADSITGLYNTGVTSSGLVPVGNVDALYIASVPPLPDPQFGGLAYAINPYNPSGNPGGPADSSSGSWMVPDANAEWISAEPIVSDLSDANPNIDASQNGTYVYQTTFTLSGNSGAQISGSWATDNLNGLSGSDGITLNGSSSGITTGSTWYNQLTGFTIGSGANFHVGLNTLSFTVTNLAQSGGNPTGLLVEFASGGGSGQSFSVTAPEPSSLALLGIGGIGLAIGAYRRRRIAAI